MNGLPINIRDVEKAGEHLLAGKENVAIAESVTAGLLQFAFSSGKKAMHYFQGGITPYNLGQKARHLNIEPIHALSCNCVSEQVANQMSAAVCRFFTSDWGISLTGYASPAPESNGEVFAYFSICHHEKVVASGRIEGLGNCTYANQLFYAEQVLRKFAELTDKL